MLLAGTFREVGRSWPFRGTVPVAAGNGQLRWAPPSVAGLTTKAVPPTGGVLTLADNTDYLLQQSAPLTRCLPVKGGRNVVWVGGESNITQKWSDNESDQAAIRFYQSDSTNARAANNGRIIHLEGFWALGYWLSDGVETNCPEAIVQLQNHRVESSMYGHQASQGDADNTPHPDSIQLWGGVKELRVDRFTGLCTYQGLTIDADLGAVGDVHLSRVNLRRNDGACEAAADCPRPWPNYLVWTGQKGSNPGNIYVDPGTVWIDHPNRAMAAGQVMWPTYQSATDAVGRYGYWPLSRADCQVLNETDHSQPGRFYEGLPAVGDFVPAGVAGLNYTTPGYLQ